MYSIGWLIVEMNRLLRKLEIVRSGKRRATYQNLKFSKDKENLQ